MGGLNPPMAVPYRSNLVLGICGVALVGNIAIVIWRLSQGPDSPLAWLFVATHAMIALSMAFLIRRHWRLPS
ncbi:hypothetical protein D3C80_1591980 [compost metagenome]